MCRRRLQAQHELKVRLDALRLLQGCLHRLLCDSHLQICFAVLWECQCHNVVEIFSKNQLSCSALFADIVCLCLKARDAIAVFASKLGPQIDHLGPGESDGGHYSLVAHKFIWDGKEVGKTHARVQQQIPCLSLI